MITSKNITDKQIKKILKLIKQETRAEAMARYGEFRLKSGMQDNGLASDYFQIHLKKIDRLRKYIFGTSNIFKLGVKWGILKSDEQLAKERAEYKKSKEPKKKKKKKKQRELF